MSLEMFTGALVSTVVQKTIDTLASRLVDIYRGRKHKKKQLSDLKTKLLAIDVVAFDAEQKQFIDPRVRDWHLRAKDVVCDAKDLLEEIEYELSKSQVEAESQSATNKVWNSLKSSLVTFFENEIESRMEQVIEDLEDLATQSDFLGLKKASGVGVGSGSSSKLTYISLRNESVMCNRYAEREFVFNWLTSDTHKNLSILSIVGMGGLGKTVLAQHVFNDPRIQFKFDIKVWVTVTPDFDVLNVSRAILDTLTGSTDHSIQQEVIQRRLKEKLTGKKFLLILDDVWNERRSKWDDMQKPLLFGGQGSKIIVTTRKEKVSVTMRSEKHLLPILREENYCDLFAKHAFQSTMAGPSRSTQIKENTNTAPTAVDSEKTAIVPFKTKRLVPNLPSAYYTDLHQEHSSNHQGSSAARSCQKKSSWPEILSTFDRVVQNQLKQEVEEIQKSKKELEDANLKVAQLEAKLSEMAQDRDDALGKLQRTIEDYARHRDEREAANRAWESTENMLQDKISTLNAALETVKDETAHLPNTHSRQFKI